MGRPDSQRATWLACAGLVALVLLLFREALLGGVLYERDVHLIWHPQVEGFVRAVAGGALPLWDPSPAFGQPLLADPGAEVLYPPTWLNLVLRPWTYFTLFAAGHLLLSAIAFFALARRWGASALAAAAGAGGWAASGPLVSLVTLFHHFASACWAPLVWLAAERALDSRRSRDVALLGTAIGLQVLAGSPDMCAMTLLAIAAWTLAVHVRWHEPRAALRLAAGAGAALLLAAALSAGLWVSSLELLLRSGRAALPDATRTYWSVHPVSLLETFLVGVPSQLPLQPAARQALFEGREPFLPTLYLGLPAIALVAAGLFGRAPRRRRLALGGLLLGAGLFALGRHAPLYDLLTTLAPPAKVLRYPVKATLLVTLAWSGLVAFGVDAWRSGVPGRRWRLPTAVPLATALLVAAAVVLALRASPTRWTAQWLAGGPLARSLALALAPHVAAGMVLLVLLASWTPARAHRLAALAALTLVIDLALAHSQPSPTAPVALYSHRPRLLSALEPLAEARVYSYDYGEPGAAGRRLGAPSAHVLARVPQGWAPQAAGALGLQMALVPQTPGRWGVRQGFDMDYRGLQSRPVVLLTQLSRLVEDRPADLLRLLKVASVTHVLAMHRVAGDLLLPVAEEPGLFERPTVAFRVPGALPRARVVGGVRVAAGPKELDALLDPWRDPAGSVVLTTGRDVVPAPGFTGRAAIVRERADALEFEVELSAEGHLVLADTWDPGWKARLDGAPVELLRADVAFRAVAVPAGRHRVEMVYRPFVAITGLAVSALTAGLLLAWAGWSLRRPRLVPGAGESTAASGSLSQAG